MHLFITDCAEPGAVSYGNTLIQRGGHPPFTVWCFSRYTFFLKSINSYFPENNFPLNKTFEEYKTNINLRGYLNGGLEGIHSATSQAYYTLRFKVYITSPYSVTITHYHNFTLASESERYRLDYLSVSGGPDGLAAMRGRPFSALGNDPEGCAQLHNVAWWYDVNCSTPMIYNANKKITYPNDTYPTVLLECDTINSYLLFEGLK